MRYRANKKVSRRRQWQQDPHQKQFLPPLRWGHNNCQKDAEANSVNLDKMAPDLSLHLPNLSVQILQIIIVMPFQDYFT